MAIPGIGLPTSYQLARPNAEQNNTSKGGSNNRLSREASAESTSNISNANNDKTENSKAALLAPVLESDRSTETVTSRKSLTEIENARRQFQLQSDKNNQNGPAGKAVQSFLEIADYERKDELNTMLGIDIYI